MQVTFEIADDAATRLHEMAIRCGYEGIDRFVADYIADLTRQDSDEELAPMSEKELQASIAMIEQSMEDIAAGRVYTVAEARRISLERLRQRQ